MKRFPWFFLLSCLIWLAIPAWAQAQNPPPGQGLGAPPPGGPPFAFEGRQHGMGPGWGPPGPQGFGMRGRGMRMREGLYRLQQELGLTEEQRTKLRQQALEGRKAAVRTRADLEIKRMELYELMAGDNPDRAQIDRKLREIADLRYALEKSRMEQLLNFRQALTPEQRTKLRQLRERGFGGGPGRPGGPERPGGPRPMERPRPAPPPQL